MNAKKGILALLCVPFVLLIFLIMVLFGGGGANQAGASKATILGPSALKKDAVPGWAFDALIAAAKKCPEITGPILAAQIDTESNWNPNAHNDGSGADGLTQFIPSTWAAWGVDGDGDGKADPRDPLDAIPTQASYMCYLVSFVKQLGNANGEIIDLALAAYNAGPGNVQHYRGIPPFDETRNYVTKIRSLAATKYSVQVPGSAAAVITAARPFVDKTMYAWGGGTLDGPGPGQSPDIGVIGFDCSALTRYAYFQGSNHLITLPRTAQEQFDATKAQQVPASQLQPGDLLFWGSPKVSGGLHHVALYIGDGQLIEAPQSGEKIHSRPFSPSGDYFGATHVFGGPMDLKART